MFEIMSRILITNSVVLVFLLGLAPARAEISSSDTQQAGETEQSDDTPFVPPQNRRRLGGALRQAQSQREANFLGLVPLLRVESVRQELKLNGQQTTVVEDLSISIREDFKDNLQSLLHSFRDQSPEERQLRNRQGKDLREKINQRVQQALHTDQFERLQQIGYQLDLRRSGAAALSGDDLAAALDLTQSQKAQLRAQGKASQTAKAEGKPPTLAEARDLTKDILSEEQHQKLDALLGTEFDLPEAMIQKAPQRSLRGRKGEREPRKRGIRRRRPEPESAEKAEPDAS